jgi:hypothetical protein
VDAAGNVDTTPAERTWTIEDTVPPETSIDSGPQGTVASASASFTFSSNKAGSTFECSLDGSPFGGCSSPQPYSGLADGPHTFEVRAIDAAGNVDPTPASRGWTVDATAPAVQAPQQVFTAWTTLGTSAVPVDLAWSASDPQSGVTQYELQQSTNGGAYAKVTLAGPTSTSMSRSLAPGSTYRFRVRAMDAAGNWSGWSEGAEFGLGAHQESSGAISYAGTWTQEASSSSYGGATRFATTSGSRASFTFTGTSVGWVTTQGPDRGKAEVWVDGVKIKTQDLYLSSEKARKMAYVQNWAQPGTHTIEIRALGTKNASSSSARVDLDAFVFF